MRELAMLAVSLTLRLDSLDERESWPMLEALLLVLPGRLLEVVFEYCFCLTCSFISVSLDKLFVALTACNL